mmetsp:Transcript_15871/g.53088  ORF Transcript_15871/g.53088 Transcript_15871/m.53088 type:complete len:108 (-) Transcript_15871:953-1276(-)
MLHSASGSTNQLHWITTNVEYQSVMRQFQTPVDCPLALHSDMIWTIKSSAREELEMHRTPRTPQDQRRDFSRCLPLHVNSINLYKNVADVDGLALIGWPVRAQPVDT